MISTSNAGSSKFKRSILGLLVAMAATSATAQVAKPYYEFKLPKLTAIPGDISLDTNGASAPYIGTGAYQFGFEAVSQYDGASFGRNFIPPDTLGAVGGTQFMAVTNGVYGVYDKYTGVRTSLQSDVAFWGAAGQTGANGDTRVMYNADAKRWIMVSFGANTKDLQVAVSDSDNALGSWKSTKFEGYAGFGFGATADYPTLAIDKNAVYIGTNNFAPQTSGGTNSYRGTTLNVIPINSLFSSTGPTTANLQQFVTTYDSASTTNLDRGYAIQGVNSRSAGSSGKVVGSSAFIADNVGYKINGLNANSATGATQGSVIFTGMNGFNSPVAARQPSAAIAANRAIIAAGDERTSSSVYEVNGRIYVVNTVAPLGLAENRIRYSVLDSNTFAVIAQGDIGQAGYDYYQGSIGVNSAGRVVIGYNRSGLDAATGKISFMARTFDTAADGSLVATSGELLLKESLTDDYHNGSVYGQASVGRQRWGDYSSVSVDPTDENRFYVMGEFAREYNLAEFGHPGGTGGSRWSTWVGVVTAVPEPSTYISMLLGLGVVGMLARRRQTQFGGRFA
jgi:PEP-CTERM motif